MGKSSKSSPTTHALILSARTASGNGHALLLVLPDETGGVVFLVVNLHHVVEIVLVGLVIPLLLLRAPGGSRRTVVRVFLLVVVQLRVEREPRPGARERLQENVRMLAKDGEDGGPWSTRPRNLRHLRLLRPAAARVVGVGGALTARAASGNSRRRRERAEFHAARFALVPPPPPPPPPPWRDEGLGPLGRLGSGRRHHPPYPRVQSGSSSVDRRAFRSAVDRDPGVRSGARRPRGVSGLFA